jgi:nucleoside-diphosphate-sugar epimerase
LINELFEAYLNNRAPKLGSCDYYRDYIYVKDVAEGIVRSTDLYNSCTINLGIGTFIKVKDFVTMFWDKLGGDRERLNFGSGPMLKDEPEQPKSYADLTRLFELTGWKPSYSFEKGIDSTIESVISNRG